MDKLKCLKTITAAAEPETNSYMFDDKLPDGRNARTTFAIDPNNGNPKITSVETRVEKVLPNGDKTYTYSTVTDPTAIENIQK